MEARVFRSDRRVHLSYEVRHRIHAAQVYPVTAPNGSTVIIYGHDGGLRLLWRGGKQPSEDGGDGTEEIDVDCPYPSIWREVNVDLEAEVQHLAIPSLSSSLPPRTAQTLQQYGVVAVACSDGSQRVLTFSLSPPSAYEADTYAKNIRGTQVKFPGETPCLGISAKIIVSAEHASSGSRTKPTSDFLFAAATPATLHVRRISVFDELTATSQEPESWEVQLPCRPLRVVFHPSAMSTILLVADVSGAVRLYDARPSDADFMSPGRWLFTYQTPFHTDSRGRVRRKPILDAKWALSGTTVLVLLSDGECGVWAWTASIPRGSSIDEFVQRGSLRQSHDTSVELGAPKGRGSKLAPMTPNTRKVKSEVLFYGSPQETKSCPRGGIMVGASKMRNEHFDETALIWYNGQVYLITSMQSWWQRATVYGSLHAPGLTHLPDVRLGHELLTSVSLFSPDQSGSVVINTRPDLLVCAEHRFIIVQTVRAAPQPADPVTPPETEEMRLGTAQLDLGGVDRALDRLIDDRPRRVGFV